MAKEFSKCRLTLFNHENKRFIVIRVQVGVFHCSLLFLSDSLPFRVEQFYFHIRICKERKYKGIIRAPARKKMCVIKEDKSVRGGWRIAMTYSALLSSRALTHGLKIDLAGNKGTLQLEWHFSNRRQGLHICHSVLSMTNFPISGIRGLRNF